MIGLARLLLPSMLLALFALAPATATADLKAKTSVVTKSDATRIVTKLSSDKSLGDRQKPRKVKVKGGGDTYKLKRVGGASAARVSLGTWKSEAYRGDAAEDVLALVGGRVKVVVKSLAGSTTVRSKVAATGSTPPPEDGDPTDPPPGTDPTDPPDPESGDTTGQAAIDQLTADLRGGFVKDISPSGSTVWELHMCENNDARYYTNTTSTYGVFVVEKFGNPWTVTDAVVKQNGDKGAIVEVTWTTKHDDTGAYEQINEPFRTLIQYVGGQWYWEGELASTGQASCDPTF